MKTQINAKTRSIAARPSVPRFKVHRNQVYQRNDYRTSAKDQAHFSSNDNSGDAAFSKLDENDEVQARRMQQRRKQIAMGKNTSGYESYCQKIPKHLRKPRSMETPSTPNFALDIPAKRWAGIVRAW
jgi:Histone RNA hairpin-binding protein RNA-binding domain